MGNGMALTNPLLGGQLLVVVVVTCSSQRDDHDISWPPSSKSNRFWYHWFPMVLSVRKKTYGYIGSQFFRPSRQADALRTKLWNHHHDASSSTKTFKLVGEWLRIAWAVDHFLLANGVTECCLGHFDPFRRCPFFVQGEIYTLILMYLHSMGPPFESAFSCLISVAKG